MSKYSNILLKNSLFINFAESEIDSLLSCLKGTTKQYAKGEYVLRRGEPVCNIGIILNGSADIIKEDLWGYRAILSRATVGNIFAEAFACAGVGQIPVSVVAAMPLEVFWLSYEQIVTPCQNKCELHSKLVQNMLKILAGKNILLTQKMEYLVKRTIREKLMAYLSEQAVIAGSNEFTIPFDRQEMADYLAVDRSALSKELGKLQREGLIVFKKNTFVIKSK